MWLTPVTYLQRGDREKMLKHLIWVTSAKPIALVLQRGRRVTIAVIVSEVLMSWCMLHWLINICTFYITFFALEAVWIRNSQNNLEWEVKEVKWHPHKYRAQLKLPKIQFAGLISLAWWCKCKEMSCCGNWLWQTKFLLKLQRANYL